MRRRDLIPLALLAVLAVLTVLFAALAARSSPDSSSLVVQNATGETFGYPDGASSFSMHLIETAAASTGSDCATVIEACLPQTAERPGPSLCRAR